MDIINGKSVHEQILASMQDNPPPNQHDFFAPLNEMDRLTRPKKLPFTPPKFNFRVFTVAGPLATPDDGIEYIRIMNLIVSGEYTNSTEENYTDKEGNLRIFLRWYEWPQGNNPNKQKLTDEEEHIANAAKKSKKAKKQDLESLPSGTDTASEIGGPELPMEPPPME